MEKQKVMLERLLSIDTEMSFEKLQAAQLNNTAVVGEVVLWNSKSRCLVVDLGNGFYGHLPIELSSIYQPLHFGETLTCSVRFLIGTTISVSVLSAEITDDGERRIILSRKDRMKETFESISNSVGDTIECCVMSIANYGIYVDVGNGITGLIHCTSLCIPRVRNYTELGFNLGDKIIAKILSVDSKKFHVSLDYKSLYENLAFTLNQDDLITATILEPINECGYFVYLNPNTRAAVDVPDNVLCNYGDKIIARVKGRSLKHPDRLRLRFVSFA